MDLWQSRLEPIHDIGSCLGPMIARYIINIYIIYNFGLGGLFRVPRRLGPLLSLVLVSSRT
uniref:Uncharacterized protein n=1 Tax=Anguilla anguilla TaxID=7936 RepID=A0A0E9WPF4_ANGAN